MTISKKKHLARLGTGSILDRCIRMELEFCIANRLSRQSKCSVCGGSSNLCLTLTVGEPCLWGSAKMRAMEQDGNAYVFWYY